MPLGWIPMIAGAADDPYEGRAMLCVGGGGACRPDLNMGSLQLDNPLSGTSPQAVAAAIDAADTNTALYQVVEPLKEKVDALVANLDLYPNALPANQAAAIRAAAASVTNARNQLKLDDDNAPGDAPYEDTANALQGAFATLFAAAGTSGIAIPQTGLEQTLNKWASDLKAAVPQVGSAAKWIIYGALALGGLYALSQVASVARALRPSAYRT